MSALRVAGAPERVLVVVLGLTVLRKLWRGLRTQRFEIRLLGRAWLVRFGHYGPPLDYCPFPTRSNLFLNTAGGAAGSITHFAPLTRSSHHSQTPAAEGAESELRVRSRLIERRAAIDHEIENGLHASHLIADGSAPPRSRVLADTAIAHPIGVEADSQAGGHRPWQVIALGYHDQVGYSENRTRSDA